VASTTPQRDEATGSASAAPAGDRCRELELPHEHDESAARDRQAAHDPAGRRATTRQAARDVASGKEDTDCYNANAPRYRRREGKAP
jgi:hypothetical protein